jgi:hypothetical protein
VLGAGGSGLVGSRGSAQSSLRTSLCTASCGHRHAAERSVGIRRGCAAGAAAISATRVPSKRMGTFRALRNSNWLKLSAKRLRCSVAARNTTATERCAAFPRKGAVQIYFPCSALTSQVKLILSPKQRAKPKKSARKTGSSNIFSVLCSDYYYCFWCRFWIFMAFSWRQYIYM